MIEKALVTGGAGFIGSHLVERLLDEGSRVLVLDHFGGERPENLDHLKDHPRLEIQKGDILDSAVVDHAMSGADVVFHLAAVKGVKVIIKDPLRAIRVNVRGTEHVLDAALRHDVRVLLASTSEIYGLSGDLPFKEDGRRVLGPTWVHRWSYSTAKALCEHMAFGQAEMGLRMSVVRYFNIYGPRLNPAGEASVVARFIALGLAGRPITVYGDGRQSRCFTYIRDAVGATILAATDDGALGKVLNIGNDREITVLELAHMVSKLTGGRSAVEHVPYDAAYPSGFEDTRRRVPSVATARDVLGFSAKTRLEEGLAETVEWFRAAYPS